MVAEQESPKPRDIAIKVRTFFMIFPSERFLEPFTPYLERECPGATCAATAVESLLSVISAASLPFQLIQNSTMQRRFDSFHASERILALIPETPGSGLSEEAERYALRSAREKMTEFMNCDEGKNFMRDQVIYELDRSLSSPEVKNAAQELLIQTLISTWSIFEIFARSFIIEWLNNDPRRASLILASPELRDFFGKQAIDIQTIGDHSFDLTKSMGTVLFKGRRVDSLATIKGAMKALFDSPDVQTALGKDLWILNQRRHLFVHNRGVVDPDYLKQTGEVFPLGERLILNCDDVELYLIAIRAAIIAIGDAEMEALRQSF